MLRMSFSWQYTLSASVAKGAGKVFVQECSHCSHILTGPGESKVWRTLAVGGGGDSPSLSLSFGEVNRYGLLHFGHKLAMM
jgi:hypothetical protein